MFVYLDNSATTQPLKAVIEEMTDMMTENFGNPSSMHKLGVAAEKKIKQARWTLEKALGAEDKSLLFTSGGTEANNMAVLGVARRLKKRGNHIITTAIEHPSVLSACKQLESEGFEVTYLPVDETGVVSLDAFKKALRKETILVAMMHANNEVGRIQPIKEIGTFLKTINPKPHFHVDAVQSFEKIAYKVKALNVDSMSISGHKVHGPKGIGALYMKKEAKFEPLVYGGGQENDQRPGTENAPGIVGFAKAVELLEADKNAHLERLQALKELLYRELSSIEAIKLNSMMDEGAVPHILNISFKGVRGEVLLHTLEMKDIFVSTGSACASNKNKSYSHVLESMGLNTSEKEGAIRFSLNHMLTEDEIKYAGEVIKASVEELRSIIKGRV
ncbi:MAG: cysteine desulfurase [Clostridia bacterium]|nr:cysteine desulfurase [Clostridia bacterium]